MTNRNWGCSRVSLNQYKNEVREFLIRMDSLNGDNHQKIAWLNNEKNKVQLIEVIKIADEQCGSCGCEFEPLYKLALELL